MELNSDWAWGSHLPILKYFTREYDIDIIMEHGSGIHSTPILASGCKQYYGFEENEDFYDQMIAEKVYTSNQVSLFRLPENIDISTIQQNVDMDDYLQMDNDILSLAKEFVIENRIFKADGLKLLFVDGYTCSRNLWIKHFKEYFDIIIIHDTEPNSYNHYQYTFKDGEYVKEFKIYTVTSPTPYTSILIRKDIGINFDRLRLYLDEYCESQGWDYSEIDIIIE